MQVSLSHDESLVEVFCWLDSISFSAYLTKVALIDERGNLVTQFQVSGLLSLNLMKQWVLSSYFCFNQTTDVALRRCSKLYLHTLIPQITAPS